MKQINKVDTAKLIYTFITIVCFLSYLLSDVNIIANLCHLIVDFCSILLYNVF